LTKLLLRFNVKLKTSFMHHTSFVLDY